MARPTLENIMSVTDPIMAYNWSISFPRIPGVQETRGLSFRAVSTSIPGTTIEAAQWESSTVRLQKAGRRRFDDTWECTLIEARDNATRDSFLAWMETAQSWKTGGGYKSEYAVPVELTLYDDKPNAIKSIKLINAFVTGIGAIQLSQSNEIVQYALTFNFDYFEDEVPSE